MFVPEAVKVDVELADCVKVLVSGRVIVVVFVPTATIVVVRLAP
jgi:hypothetical protein